jgi:hypothetical protein
MYCTYYKYIYIYIMIAKLVYQVQILGFTVTGRRALCCPILRQTLLGVLVEWIHKTWKGDRKPTVPNL